MWEARAEYADGTTVSRYFEYDASRPDNEQQYDIECWLIDWHPDCTWYSVNYIDIDPVNYIDID